MEVTYAEMNFEDDQVYFGEPPKENWKEWISNRKRECVLVSAVVLLLALACSTVVYLTVVTAEYSDEIGNQNNFNRIEREKLLKYLQQVSSKKAYISGLYYSYALNDTYQKTTKITKVFPGVVSTTMPRRDANNTEWMAFIEEVIFIWNKHHLVKIFWWFHKPFWNMDIFTYKSGNITDREEKWNDLMLDGSFLNTKWKEQLDFVAPHLQKLQTARVVPILDILPELNKYHYDHYNYNCIWKGRPGMNGSARLYKMTQDYLKQKHNYISVIWAWSVDPTISVSNVEEYWPGDDYVDVVSVYMQSNRELTTSEYQKLVRLGDKPMSMDRMFYTPTIQLLSAQPRWTWFTAFYLFLDYESMNPSSEVQATFNSASVINAGNITYFDNRT